jgi:hypothetical protein
MNPDLLAAEIERLIALDLQGLRREWHRRYGSPPALRSSAILRSLLAWRIQAQALGGLDQATRRALANTGRTEAEGLSLGIGAVLTRQWRGQKHQVVVEATGFRWEGKTYRSLSAAATAIAGSKWNGPRFFGLRQSS